jgi:hypothetical protein
VSNSYKSALALIWMAAIAASFPWSLKARASIEYRARIPSSSAYEGVALAEVLGEVPG